MVRGLDTAAIKSVHRDDIIIFKEASSDKEHRTSYMARNKIHPR